jgi:hypothetical protein
MKPRITVPCSRCGGSGRMPFSPLAGVCFKCLGSGKNQILAPRRGPLPLFRISATCTSTDSVVNLAVGDAATVWTVRARNAEAALEKFAAFLAEPNRDKRDGRGLATRGDFPFWRCFDLSKATAEAAA